VWNVPKEEVSQNITLLCRYVIGNNVLYCPKSNRDFTLCVSNYKCCDFSKYIIFIIHINISRILNIWYKYLKTSEQLIIWNEESDFIDAQALYEHYIFLPCQGYLGRKYVLKLDHILGKSIKTYSKTYFSLKP
jgi:hypothetical protein